MNRFPRHLSPSARGTASLYERLCHVRSFQYRAAIRCIHSGTNGKTGEDSINAKALNTASDGKSDTQDEGLHSADHGQRTPSASVLRIKRYKPFEQDSRKSLKDLKSPKRVEAFRLHQENKEPLRQTAHTQPNSRRHQRLYTIVYDIPEEATKPNLLGHLDRAEFTAKQWKQWTSKGDDQAIIMLFTPGLVNFVENDATLVPDVLKKMTRMSKWNHENPLEIDVVCACVDGLAPEPEKLSTSRGQRPPEGFTILHGPRNVTLPSPGTEDEAPPSRSPSMQSTITIRKGEHGPPDLTLPLANTLFKNGRLSTLLVSRWQWSAAQDTFVLIKGPSERANVNVNMFLNVSERIPKHFIPGVRLTPAREIVSGLGNIVRTINFGIEDGTGPASRELEPIVTKYLEAKGYGNTTIDVWAMIVPPESVPKGAKLGILPRTQPQLPLLTPSPDELQRKWLDNVDEEEVARYLTHWIRRGNAKLCRVLSGGGGWGAKQGLLSLDPQTSYSEVPEARFDFSGGSLEDQQTSALGNIAQPGAFIQFFVALREPTSQPRIMMKRPNYSYMRKSAVFGAVPSTVDDVVVPLPRADGQAQGGKHARKSNSIHFKAGHFGFVSERGMFLRHGPRYKPDRLPSDDNFTKIDLPYSYFSVDYRLATKEQEQKRPSVIRKVDSVPSGRTAQY
ncbi:hypothetical protein VTL71DRAFT_12140 [Oculimacula yallundae]|uniref:Uncharacterized protein n=1 Tax=Oculimacula yallundae TaxID=86028 RepID=A0ABR4CT87_9HELO